VCGVPVVRRTQMYGLTASKRSGDEWPGPAAATAAAIIITVIASSKTPGLV